MYATLIFLSTLITYSDHLAIFPSDLLCFTSRSRCVVDEQFVPKVGMTFKTLEEAGKFYKDYSKLVDFSTEIRNPTQKGDEIKNQLITCNREGVKIQDISNSEHKPLSSNKLSSQDLCTYIEGLVLNHSYPCCLDRAEMLKQYREISMFVRRTIENNNEAGIRLSKTYQLFIAVVGNHRELSFIEKDVRNYITRKAWNWCFWHIMKKIPSKLNGYKPHEEFEQEMSHVIWNSFTKDAFDRNWNDFVTKYGVGGNKWLSGFMTYEVVDEVSNSTFNKFFVTYDAISREVKCQCLLFESRDILCRHSLSVLSVERVDKVAPKYILKHWSKNIKRRHTHIKSSQDETLLEPRRKRFNDLVFQSHNICEFVAESEEFTRILHHAFDNVMAEMQEYQAKSKGGRPKNGLGPNMEKKIANATKKKKKPTLSELNLLDGGSMIQSSSSIYDAHDMNYPREDYRSFSFY
ncbi:hypothetical protein Ahy_B01g053932 [Arachis hypogaea]|uniref:Protein FAR1-RELATED SEQUENCE n=1 Tax=Arachis hypogaea TaxID=3818 RepID=A0A445ASW8_ARAHY|nr:hypothetical protein Ahy_B01g053932 [Arachis hypogaea]